MLTCEDLVEFAKLCARNSRKEYQAEAGKLGDVPQIDEDPLPSEDR
jgi:hypothetical protein